MKFVRLCSAALAQPVSSLPPSLYTHHFCFLPSGEWANPYSAGNALSRLVTHQFVFTWLCKQFPTQPCPPVPPRPLSFCRSMLDKGLQIARRGFTVACLPIGTHNEEKSGSASRQPHCRLPWLYTYCTRERASQGASPAREGARREGDSSRGVRMRPGVVFHKAALKVSWQVPAARLCKETTETSRSAEQQPLCCLDFLRNLNELFVKNH